jgi:hypothetical protein
MVPSAESKATIKTTLVNQSRLYKNITKYAQQNFLQNWKLNAVSETRLPQFFYGL